MSETSSRNKAVVRRIYEEMWNKGDPAAAAGIFTRPAGVEKFVGGFLSAFPDLEHTIEQMVEEGDLVAVQFSAHGTHQGQWMHFAATNKPIRYTGVTVARVSGGRVIEHNTWWDRAGLIEQIISR